MYKNVGKKLENIALASAVMGIILSLLLGGIIITVFGGDGGIVFGLVIMIAGSILSWLSAILLYAFGELVDCTQRIANDTKAIAENSRHKA